MDLNKLATEARISNIEKYSQGLEFNVYTATSPQHGKVVVRVPQVKVFHNENDPNVNAKALIKQEIELYHLFENTPVPVPKAIGLFEIDGYPAMVAQFVESDDSTPSAHSMGCMAALIHSAKVPDGLSDSLVAMECENAISTLVQRMVRRFTQFARLEPSALEWIPTQEMLQDSAKDLGRLPNCVLHMDFRDVNLRTYQGNITAVFDWTNTLVGPAAIDIFRILELTRPEDTFMQGYLSVKPFPPVSNTEETLLRLDAALMLSLVFMSYAPDPEQRDGRVQRVEELARSLSSKY